MISMICMTSMISMISIISMISMIPMVPMISMILSVFSWSPFVGPYLQSFSGHFSLGVHNTYSVQMFISAHLSWMSEGNCFQLFCDRPPLIAPQLCAQVHSSVNNRTFRQLPPALLEHGFCCLEYLDINCSAQAGEGARGTTPFFSHCSHPLFPPLIVPNLNFILNCIV